MNFDYYYGDESNQFAFYRIPRSCQDFFAL